MIKEINFKVEKLTLKKVFKIAFAQMSFVETIFIQIITDDGTIGYGESQPFEPVTGESIASTLANLNLLSSKLIGQRETAIEKMHEIMNQTIIGNSSAKAGLDIALHDILAKKANMPLYQLLGGYENQVMTDITIGIDSQDEMVNSAKQYVEEGFKALKIKAGIDYKQDIATIKAIRKAVGPSVQLRMDANQGWDVKSTLAALKELRNEDIELVEQPLPAFDLYGLGRVTANVPQKIMVDEGMHTPVDALNVVRKPFCDVLNIKLMKSSGIYPAIAINNIAQSANLPCMVGCMTESVVGIAAAAALVAAKKNIKYADVDSFHLLKEHPLVTADFQLKEGIVYLSDKPGLGVDVKLNF